MKRALILCSTILLGLIFGMAWISHDLSRAASRESRPVSIKEFTSTTAISPTDVVGEMLGQINRERALSDLRRLTGEEPVTAGTGWYTITNRLTGSDGLHRATDYISKELASLGYPVSFQNWSRSGRSDRNVIARKPGAYASDEEIYFVAHVDGVKSSAGERYPAADDDASGVVDNLELARILSSHAFSRTLVLLFTTGEEQGRDGVRSYLDQLSPPELASIKYAVNVDMVGYDGNDDGVMELWHGGHSPSLALTQIMSETIRAYQLDLAPRFIVGCG